MKYFFALCFFILFFSLTLFRDIPSLYFFSDDFIWLLDAKHDGVEKIGTYFVDSGGFFYRPVTKVYFWVMWRAVQDQAYWYHIVNIVLHILVSLSVFFTSSLLLGRVLDKKKNGPRLYISFATALLFFVHSAHLENIIWISAVGELIPALCTLVGMCLLGKYYSTPRFVYIGALLLLFVLGLGCHEYMVVYPVVLYLTHLFFVMTENGKLSLKQLLVQPFKKSRNLYVSLFIIEVVYLILRAVAGSHWSGGDYSYNLVLLPFNFVGNLIGYIGILLSGVWFVDIYFQARFLLRDNVVLALGILFAGGLISFFVLRYLLPLRKTKSAYLVGFSILFFVVTLLPFLGFGGLAERYVYLASFSFILIVCYLCWLISVWVQNFTDSVADVTAYILIIGLFVCYFSFVILKDQDNWKFASQYVASRVVEFQDNCDQFSEGELLVRHSPPNRLGRAWVYQVGYEESANLYCDKNLRIQRR